MANEPRLLLGNDIVQQFDPQTGAYFPVIKLDGGSTPSGTYIGQVGSLITLAQVNFQRETGTVAYAIDDVVSNSASAPTILTFPNMARVKGGSGYILKARLETNQNTCTAQFRLHLYQIALAAQQDNVQFVMPWTSRATHLGYIDFPAMETEGTGSFKAFSHIDLGTSVEHGKLMFTCTGTLRDIYGELETLSAFTPNSAQAFFIELGADTN